MGRRWSIAGRGLLLIALLAGCSSPAPEPTPSRTATLSADDDARAMWQCVTFEWGYRLYDTEDAAREHCTWLRANNPSAYSDYLVMYQDRASVTDPALDPSTALD
jgi:hypothetical protein